VSLEYIRVHRRSDKRKKRKFDPKRRDWKSFNKVRGGAQINLAAMALSGDAPKPEPGLGPQRLTARRPFRIAAAGSRLSTVQPEKSS
jgi:hypothetical protein